MRIKAGIMIGGLVVAAAMVSAQSRTAAPQPVSDALRSAWDEAKKNITDSAELMPESTYSFKPVDTVRTFGQILGHVAGANYVFCSAAKGEKSPQAENAFETLATKAAIVKALGESMAYCDGAFQALTDRSAAEPIDMPFGGGKGARAAALMGNVGHLSEHYGNLVTYFRIKGIVPPTSRR
jgi:uncharacterized damage-inducible protein DinB